MNKKDIQLDLLHKLELNPECTQRELYQEMGVVRVFDRPALPNPNWDSNNPDPATSSAPWRVYNIGNNNPVELLNYIEVLEASLGIKVEKELLPLQPGDVPNTCANIDDLIKEFGYKPSISVEQGVENFVRWYQEYHNV